ncbi:MAG: TauD/TfdA family dioxygenase [Candidatus Sericytochromatia bacterium]
MFEPVIFEQSVRSASLNSLQQAFKSRGAVILRDLEHTPEDLVDLSEIWAAQDFLGLPSFTQTPQQLIGANLRRTPLTGYPGVFVASGTADLFELPLHGELYYQYQHPPDLLWFYCATAPTQQGETWLCDGQALFAALPEQVQTAFLSQKIVYTRVQSAENWQRDYQTSDFKALKAFLASQAIESVLEEDGALLTRFTTPALRWHQGQPVFINNVLPFALRELSQPDALRAHVRFEDGQKIPSEMVLLIRDTARQLTCAWPWQTGDILLVDNTRILHGRGTLHPEPRCLYLRMSHLQPQPEQAGVRSCP